MAISVKHAFTSAKSDGADATQVQPSNWNAEHNITLAADKLLGRDSSGAGAVQEISCTSFGRGLIASADIALFATDDNNVIRPARYGTLYNLGSGNTVSAT